MNFKITKQWTKSFCFMLLSVILMGFSVSLLVLTRMGTDPCSSMNYGVARTLGLSFGNYQLLFNLALLIFVLITDRTLIGTGTIGNMVVVGYTADFFSWIWSNVCHIPTDLPFAVRIGILLPTLLVFVAAAASYMNSGHGMAPYDAVPFILSNKLEKYTKRTGLFKPVRFTIDLLAMVIGYFTGGEVGLMTILMVLLLAPTVEYTGKLFQKWGLGQH